MAKFSLITPVGMVCLSVCTDETDKDAIENWASFNYPTGISSRWRISKDTHFADKVHTNPCPCERDDTRWHFLLKC